jgi:vacuolar-type H+-ATPase subunit D/Vma8
MIERTKRENENLTNLKGQMKDMSAGFEVLKNTRIENKQKLEKRFDDTYNEIRENRQETITAMEDVQEIVAQF